MKKVKMTTNEASVYRFLKSENKPHNASWFIMRVFGKMNFPGTPWKRKLRQIIKNLIEVHGKRIGSSSKGYFIIRTKKDLEEATRMLRSQALSRLRRLSILEKTTMAKVLGQLKLEVENDV